MTVDDAGLFESGKLRSVWFDVEGFLKAWVPAKQGKTRSRRKSSFFAAVTTAAMFGIASTALGVAEPTQFTLAWPVEKTAAATKHALLQSIKELRRLTGIWAGESSPVPVERSITAAQWIVPQIPDVIVDAQAGLNGDGNVFMRLSRGAKVAYVTVEPQAMHLLVMEEGQPNVYIDDERFSGKIVPESIKKAIAERFST